LQRQLDAVQYRFAEGIVLIDHANLVDVGVPEFVNLFAGLVVVGSANVDDFVFQGFVE
jgi:catalase (peroxidase I)